MDDIRITVKKRVFNAAYFHLLSCLIPLQIIYGGASSGKSVFVAQRAVIDVLGGGRNYLVVRNVKNTMRHSCFNEVKKAISKFKLADAFEINRSELIVTCKENGCQFLFHGLDDSEKIKSVVPEKGVLTDIWIEEATEINESDFNQLKLRLRGISSKVKRITLTFNPISKLHWINVRFFKGFTGNHYQDEEKLIMKTTYKDNAFLTSQDKKVIEEFESIDTFYWTVYGRGEWGVLGSAIFDNWHVEDLSSIAEEFNIYRNGLDFGFSNDPTALVRSSRKDNRIFILNELYEKGLTNPEIAEGIKPIIGAEMVCCDSAEPKSIVEIQGCGINAYPVKKGKDSVKHGIQWLKQKTIIVDKKCQNMRNELTLYQWKKDRDGNSINVPMDKNNHLIDGLRYAYEDEMMDIGIGMTTTADIIKEDAERVMAT